MPTLHSLRHTASFGSVAYAKATRARRERHLRGFEAIWRNLYQTAAFTVLFRMALYALLRRGQSDFCLGLPYRTARLPPSQRGCHSMAMEDTA